MKNNPNFISSVQYARMRGVNGMTRRGIHFDTPRDPAAPPAEKVDKLIEGVDKMMQKVEKSIADLEALTKRTDATEAQLGELKELRASVAITRSALKERLGGDFPGLEDEKTKFDLGKLLQLRRRVISAKDAGFELEVLENSHKKYGRMDQTKDGIISTLTGAEGGVALPVEVSKQIIAAARAMGQLDKLGTYFPQLSGLSSFAVPLEEPNTTSHDGIIITPTPTAEAEPFKLRTPKWKAETFSPKKLAVGIGVTNEFIKEGGQFLVDYVLRAAGRDFKNELEFNVLNGSGQQGQVPRGLLTRDDLTDSSDLIVSRGNDGRPLSFSDLVGMEQAIINANRLEDSGRFGYYLRSTLIQGLRTQFSKQSESGTVLDSLPITPLQFAGVKKLSEYTPHQLAFSTLIKRKKYGNSTEASTIVFGDWSYLWVPFWGPMEMLMSNVATVGGMSAFANDMTFIRFTQMYDVGVMAPDAFTKLDGFTPGNPS